MLEQAYLEGGLSIKYKGSCSRPLAAKPHKALLVGKAGTTACGLQRSALALRPPLHRPSGIVFDHASWHGKFPAGVSRSARQIAADVSSPAQMQRKQARSRLTFACRAPAAHIAALIGGVVAKVVVRAREAARCRQCKLQSRRRRRS